MHINLLKNDNLIKECFNYLNPKDLSLVCQVNKKFNKISLNFNNYWEEECNNYFCSDYVHNKVFDNIFDDDLFEINSFNWKEFFRLGIHIKNSWCNLEFKIIKKIKKDLKLFIDIVNIKNELYSTLKDYFPLPKLRKENLLLEKECSSIFKTYLYDFQKKQEELYDYYNGINDIIVKNRSLPLANILKNVSYIIYEFNESDFENLVKFRWYSYDAIENIYNSEEDSFLIIENNILDSDSVKRFQERTDNTILFILGSILLSVTHFCKLSYNYIKKYVKNYKAFLNEYTKRYKSYIESAIYINDYLENLNVIVNLLYEMKVCLNFPKFSIFKMMIISWNREVLDNFNKFNIFSENLLTISDDYYKIQFQKILKPYNLIDNEYDLKSDISYIIFNRGSKDNTNISDNSTLSNTNISSISNSISDIEYNFDLIKLFENGYSLFSDSIYNEYNIFQINNAKYLNDSSFIDFEENMNHRLKSLIRNQCKSLENINLIFNFFKQKENLSSNLLNRTKFKIITTVYHTIMEIIQEIISKELDEYISVINEFSFKTPCLLNLKCFENFRTKHIKLFDYLLKRFIEIIELKNICIDNDAAAYLILSYMKIEKNYEILILSHELIEWYNSQEDKFNQIIKKIEKEINKLYIPKLNRNKEYLMSYNHKMKMVQIEKIIYIEFNTINLC